jgi:transketolase N-terminal domain/subunit
MKESSGLNQPVEGEKKAVKITIQLDAFTNVMLQEAGLVVIAFPIATPKWTALGFLWTMIDEFTAFYNALESANQAKNKKPGIIKGTMSDALALGRGLLKP